MIVYLCGGVAVMAVITWLTRSIPLILVRDRIRNRFIRSLLFYLPYAVLGAMTFPAILYSTASFQSALVGSAVALILSYFRRSLLVVALSATGAVLIVEQLLRLA